MPIKISPDKSSSQTTSTHFHSVRAISSSSQMTGIPTPNSACTFSLLPSLDEGSVFQKASLGITLKVIVWITNLPLPFASGKAPNTTLLLLMVLELWACNNSGLLNKQAEILLSRGQHSVNMLGSKPPLPSLTLKLITLLTTEAVQPS